MPDKPRHAELERRSGWQQWLQQPQKLWLHQVVFQIHFALGALAGAYLTLMSVTGSVIVYRDKLSRWTFVEWIVKLHTDLLLGSAGRLVNGIGAVCLTLLCLTGAIIWWPGMKNWRRSLTVSWGAQFARINWDLHSALGFWCFLFVLLWAISGIYFSFPSWFYTLLLVDSADRVTDRGLFWLAELHFGRFGWFSEAIWSILGLVPAVLAFTGIFICCRRMIYKKNSNPYRALEVALGKDREDAG
jgi:uncharacterized iron-regulated membrane protein